MVGLLAILWFAVDTGCDITGNDCADEEDEWWKREESQHRTLSKSKGEIVNTICTVKNK